jgi:hypothetical protein
VWTDRYTNHDTGQSGDAYLDITEHTDGTRTGKWGTDENTAAKIEHGERVTADLLQWEAVTEEKHQPRYRVRVTLKGKTLELACTVTCREDGKVKGNTANSILTRKYGNTTRAGMVTYASLQPTAALLADASETTCVIVTVHGSAVTAVQA